MGILKTNDASAANGEQSRRIGRSPFASLGVCLLFAAFVTGLAPSATAQTEYDLKAVFLCRFAQYVEWPATAFVDTATPITIGILGDDPFGKIIEEATAGETPQNRKIVIKRFKRLEDVSPCQILFISKSEKARIGQILKSLNGTGTLTVGDTEQFARMGGVINFTIQSGKVKLEINANAARSEGLKISAQLLKLATLVQ